MQKYSEHLKEAIPYVVLLSIISLDIMIFAGVINVLFAGNETIIAGVIAFCGAIIGGAITLMGVLISIRHSTKLRTKNELPDKINHIENALNSLEKVTEYDLAFDAHHYKNRFILPGSFYVVNVLEDYHKFIIEAPEVLKKDFIFIDAEAYKMYLDFKNTIQRLWNVLYNGAKLEMEDFKEEILTKEEDASVPEDIKYLKNLDDKSFIEKNIEVNKELFERDKEFTYQLGLMYADLHVQLTLKHKELIKKLDY